MRGLAGLLSVAADLQDGMSEAIRSLLETPGLRHLGRYLAAVANYDIIQRAVVIDKSKNRKSWALVDELGWP